MIDKLIKKRFGILVLLIVALASFLRFYNYFSRFGIAYDQAHDALVARFAVSHFLLPLVGPFSSGAQFQTSGIWYWFLMVPTALFNGLLIAPWVTTTLYCILFVLLVTLAGEKMVDKKFGLIAGLAAALSTSQIGQSTNLSLTALISMASLGAIYFAYKYLDSPKNKYIFAVGFFTALAPTIHLQGVLLVVLIPIFLAVAKVKNVKAYLFLGLGLFVPLIPLIIFDLQNNFVNITGLLNHLFFKQYEVSYEVLGRRWLTYIFVFWPTVWSNIIGGYIIISYITIISIAAVLANEIRNRRLAKIWIVVAATFVLDIILTRYVRSPLYDSYLNFLHPFIYFLTAFAVIKITKQNLFLGSFLLLLILGGTVVRDVGEVTHIGNNNSIQALNEMKALVNKKYKGGKLDFYDYQYLQVSESLPLVLDMDTRGKVSSKGRKIGIVSTAEATMSASIYKQLGIAGGRVMVDLNSSSSASLVRAGWHRINPEDIYNNTENWHK